MPFHWNCHHLLLISSSSWSPWKWWRSWWGWRSCKKCLTFPIYIFSTIKIMFFSIEIDIFSHQPKVLATNLIFRQPTANMLKSLFCFFFIFGICKDQYLTTTSTAVMFIADKYNPSQFLPSHFPNGKSARKNKSFVDKKKVDAIGRWTIGHTSWLGRQA